MKETDRKAGAILDAALPVFVRHGFRKTSMADIARAAGISRAALYLSFGSKEELFRAGSLRAHAKTMQSVEAALAGDGDVFRRIELAMAAFQRDLIAPFAGSADAAELFDANMALAKDITLAARAQLVTLLARVLADAQASDTINLDDLKASPTELAGIIVAAVEGIKEAQAAGHNLLEDTQLFLRLMRLALTRRMQAS